MSDILDTRFEDTDIDLEAGFISLGEELNITEKDETIRKVCVAAGWDSFTFNSMTLDMDLSLFLLDRNGKTRVDEDFIFYNQPEALNGGVRHRGDNRSGAGDGDDETISLFLESIPFDILHAYFVLSIYQGYEKEQYMGMARNCYIRLFNEETGEEIVRYKMDVDLKERSETGVVAVALNREGPKWHFKPLMEFYPDGLSEIASKYGMVIKDQ